MAFDSDAELLKHVRGRVGVSHPDDLPEDVMEEEIEDAKRRLSSEIEERIHTDGSLNFYDKDSAQRSLFEYMCLRAERVKARGNKGKARSEKAADAPSSIAALRRFDYEDRTMNHWRNRMISHLNKVTE